MTVTWEQVISPDFAGWTLYWGGVSGGPYNEGSLYIPYDGSGQTAYETEEVLTGPDNVETTYYFVLTAWDVDGNESDPSNEASALFDFAAPAVPTSFTIVINAAPVSGGGP